MATQKHLKDLLSEDQEPFHLTDYIAHRRSQLKKQLQTKKPNLSLSKSTSFQKSFCFFSTSAFTDSPDPRRSPLFDFSVSPASSRAQINSAGSNALFLQVPAKTAALLLEAAMRIQKQNSKPKTRTQRKNSGLGLLGSMIKKLTNRTRTIRKPEIGNEDKSMGLRNPDPRLSSVGCESNNGDGESLDFLESCRNSTSSSGSSGRSSEDEFGYPEQLNGSDFSFSVSPFSPFRFALYRSPSSPDRRSPSPVFSPARRKFEECVKDEKMEEEEEEKEQNSPVSVLDPPFHDDEAREEDEDSYDLECSYEGAKQQLLQKLRRFERLAELDPLQLERRLVEREDDEELGMKRLISDLIAEEEGVMKRVWERLESWKEVEANTINMMVEMDLRREADEWRKVGEQCGETAREIEYEIFEVLVEEVLEELV